MHERCQGHRLSSGQRLVARRFPKIVANRPDVQVFAAVPPFCLFSSTRPCSRETKCARFDAGRFDGRAKYAKQGVLRDTPDAIAMSRVLSTERSEYRTLFWKI